MPTETIEAICPSCGHWHILNEITGHCADCSPDYCISCGSQFYPDAKWRKVCWACRDEAWLKKYADPIEALLSFGYTLDQTRLLVSRDFAPRCTHCGGFIKSGRGETLFCTKFPQCRSAKRRYRTLVRKYNGNRSMAYIHTHIEILIEREQDATGVRDRAA